MKINKERAVALRFTADPDQRYEELLCEFAVESKWCSHCGCRTHRRELLRERCNTRGVEIRRCHRQPRGEKLAGHSFCAAHRKVVERAVDCLLVDEAMR